MITAAPDPHAGHSGHDPHARHDADVRTALSRAADAADASGHPEAYDRLRSRLADRAERAGILDVAYRTVDTPVGTLLVAATEQGLVRVAYPIEGHEKVLDVLAGQVSPRVLRAPGRLDPVARQLDEYFAGRRRVFDVPLDMRLARGFRRLVLDHLREIDYGTTASYGTVAAAAGSPAAVRAVGTACARNPLPVVVPCHRVVLADGSIGRYVGGVTAKKALLDLEAAA
ncbi:MAG: methylated-DNA--[protein]-cysteine S-methyltransferase [Actinopolymorphaceae bacterium]